MWLWHMEDDKRANGKARYGRLSGFGDNLPERLWTSVRMGGVCVNHMFDRVLYRLSCCPAAEGSELGTLQAKWGSPSALNGPLYGGGVQIGDGVILGRSGQRWFNSLCLGRWEIECSPLSTQPHTGQQKLDGEPQQQWERLRQRATPLCVYECVGERESVFVFFQTSFFLCPVCSLDASVPFTVRSPRYWGGDIGSLSQETFIFIVPFHSPFLSVLFFPPPMFSLTLPLTFLLREIPWTGQCCFMHVFIDVQYQRFFQISDLLFVISGRSLLWRSGFSAEGQDMYNRA